MRKLGSAAGSDSGADYAAPRDRDAEQDAAARGHLAYTATIIRDALSPDDANAFAQAPEIEKARIFLRAVATLHHAPGCGMYGFFMADMDEVSPGANQYLLSPEPSMNTPLLDNGPDCIPAHVALSWTT
jgi:hypothetical protein